jgi:hypothetical protein
MAVRSSRQSGVKVGSGLEELISGNVNTKLGSELGTKGAVQTENGEHQNADSQVKPLDLTSHVTPPGKALEATPNRHTDDHSQQHNAPNSMPEHGGHAAKAERALHAW